LGIFFVMIYLMIGHVKWVSLEFTKWVVTSGCGL
jgi:hypothetical protein